MHGSNEKYYTEKLCLLTKDEYNLLSTSLFQAPQKKR